MTLAHSLSALLGTADLAVDFGTSTIRVADVAGRRQLEAPAATALRGGAVCDVDAAVAIVGPLLARVRGTWPRRLRVVASTPSDVDAAERAALVEVLRRCGAQEVAVYPEPLAAAVGSQLDLGSTQALMIVDLGHGVTDAVVLRGGAVVASAARRVGCADLIAALARTLWTHGRGAAASAEATALLRELELDEAAASGPVAAYVGRGGAQVPPVGERRRGADRRAVPRGRHGAADRRRLLQAVAPTLETIFAVPADLARNVTDEVGAELIETGIWITGGGALLQGVERALADRTGLDVRRVADPLGAVLQGNRSLYATARRFASWER